MGVSRLGRAISISVSAMSSKMPSSTSAGIVGGGFLRLGVVGGGSWRVSSTGGLYSAFLPCSQIGRLPGWAVVALLYLGLLPFCFRYLSQKSLSLSTLSRTSSGCVLWLLSDALLVPLCIGASDSPASWAASVRCAALRCRQAANIAMSSS